MIVRMAKTASTPDRERLRRAGAHFEEAWKQHLASPKDPAVRERLHAADKQLEDATNDATEEDTYNRGPAGRRNVAMAVGAGSAGLGALIGSIRGRKGALAGAGVAGLGMGALSAYGQRTAAKHYEARMQKKAEATPSAAEKEVVYNYLAYKSMPYDPDVRKRFKQSASDLMNARADERSHARGPGGRLAGALAAGAAGGAAGAYLGKSLGLKGALGAGAVTGLGLGTLSAHAQRASAKRHEERMRGTTKKAGIREEVVMGAFHDELLSIAGG